MLGRNTLLRVSVFCDIVSFPKCASWSENNTEPLLPQKSPALLLRQPFQPWAWGLEDEFREVGCCPTGKVWVPQRLHKTFSGLGSPSGPAWRPRLSGAVKGAEGIPIWAQPSPVVFSGLVQWPLATSTLSTRFFSVRDRPREETSPPLTSVRDCLRHGQGSWSQLRTRVQSAQQTLILLGDVHTHTRTYTHIPPHTCPYTHTHITPMHVLIHTQMLFYHLYEPHTVTIYTSL